MMTEESPVRVKPRRPGAIEPRQVCPQQRKGRLATVIDDKCYGRTSARSIAALGEISRRPPGTARYT
jgi:hypothetical protein